MARNIFRPLIVVLALYVIANDASIHSAESCPSFCVCDTWYGLQRASCISRHLYSIHTGAPSSVQALDVSNNSISALNNYELADAGLTKLKYLNLSANAISVIGLNAFDELIELTVLDLSQNHLYYLLSDVFISTINLRILRLSGNNFNSHVPKLECPWLTDLTLNACQISHLPVDTFVGLSHLRYLDLSNNLLIQMDSLTLQTLWNLKKLTIEGNPWSCNNLTHDLQTYLMKKNIEYHPVCIKKSEPKKFEKMIVYNPILHRSSEKHRPSITNANVKKNMTMTKQNVVPTLNSKNVTACANVTEETNFTKTLNAISPYWFFATGFLFGSACSIFTCYFWLTKRIICRHRYRRQENNDIQRISLLQDLWQPEDFATDENEHRRISCPNTPPPPYHEVMLRPGLYRSPSVIVN